MVAVASANPTKLVALASDPASGSAGDAYWSTTLGAVRVHNGTAWETWVTATVGPTAPSSPVAGDLWLDTTEPEVLDIPDFGTAIPAVPASGMKMFTRSIAGRRLPAIVGPSGLDTSLQPFFGRNGLQIHFPVENSTTYTPIGGAALTATGTATAAAFTAPSTSTSTAYHSAARRLDYLVTTAAATAVAGFRQSRNTFGVSSAAKMGGFFGVCRFSPATGAAAGASRRTFCGVSNSTAAPTDVDPSTLATNTVGVGYSSVDTNWQIYHRGSGTMQKVDTGITKPTAGADRPGVYELALYAAPGSLAINYEFSDAFTGQRFTGTIAAGANAPANGTALSWRGYHSVGGVSSVVGMTLFGLYLETDT